MDLGGNINYNLKLKGNERNLENKLLGGGGNPINKIMI